MLPLSEKDIDDIRRALIICVNVHLFLKPDKDDIHDINELYDMIYPFDHVEELTDDIDIIREGKTLIENSNRKFTKDEISCVINYIEKNIYDQTNLDRAKQIYENLKIIYPEYKKQDKDFNPVKKRIAILLPRREEKNA